MLDKRVYEAYLASPEWKKFREKALENNFYFGKYHCQRCGWDFPRDKLEIHHKHYRTLGRERLEDVLALCRHCHAIEDSNRAEESRRYAAEQLYDARLFGWAAAIYGEDNVWKYDPSILAEEFEDWLDRRGDDDDDY
ncbi:HNH endonuclease [Desulfocurvibacter africanus]|uniref:HNH endonuclease n=1 Tax=Desulfocurvibacter africanus TaxID=873 RepID=UPI0004179BCF|nr:HNH endonuclease signature motif containing protein [Desulfocurvibacter africanus]